MAPRSLSRILLGTGAALLLALAGPARAQCVPTVLFTDDMENGINGWTTYVEVYGAASTCEPEWHQDVEHQSPFTGWTNAPYQAAGGTNGDEVCHNYLQSPTLVVPPGTASLELDFFHGHIISDAFDFGVVEVSTNGTDWSAVSEQYNGMSAGLPGMTPVTLDLAGTFTSGEDYMVRFHFYSGQQVGGGAGWALDDVALTACTNSPIAVEPTSWGRVKAFYGPVGD